jgi:nucleoside 2-deoxyribosyltransferase
MVYLIGSMKNPKIPFIARALRSEGFEVFDDWYSPGKNADDEWQAYEQQRGRSFKEALDGAHAWDVFRFDLKHLDLCSIGVLVAPAGKSAHIELGYLRGRGKPAYVYMDGEPERYDVMYRFATGVCTDYVELVKELKYYEL